MKDGFRVYLGGPVDGYSYKESETWRNAVADILLERSKGRIEGISPLRYYSFLNGDKEIKGAFESNILGTSKAITYRDRNDVYTCDLMLVNFLGSKKGSIGTCIEYGWADAWRKPIVVVMDEENVHNHPIINEISGFIVRTLDEAIDTTLKILI